MSASQRPSYPLPVGRGAGVNPPNRFEPVRVEFDAEQFSSDPELLSELQSLPTEYFLDESRTIVSSNDSPDIPFRYSLNPYRGCLHGCSYCYARPYHEYLGLNAGLDFESRIFVKPRAAELFREFLARPRWQPEVVVLSGVTDCYQPCERSWRLTRACLEVAWEARQPIGLITKNALVARDLDLLAEMSALGIVRVNVSLTTLDAELAAAMEPRTSRPAARLRAISQLRAAGVPVNIMVAPVIPGLNDSEIPAILQAAADAGAQSAGYTLLRLPLSVKPVFVDWLERTQPLKKEKIASRIRACRDGAMSSSAFGERMTGRGEMAGQIQSAFQVFRKKYGLDQTLPPLVTSRFRPPRPRSGQLRLF